MPWHKMNGKSLKHCNIFSILKSCMQEHLTNNTLKDFSSYLKLVILPVFMSKKIIHMIIFLYFTKYYETYSTVVVLFGILPTSSCL